MKEELDITMRVLRFFRKIRYKILVTCIIVGAIVFYFSRFMPRDYTVSMAIFTGIASSSGLEDGQSYQDSRLKNTFDNIINITKSQDVMEEVSIKRLAIGLVKGNLDIDNEDILASTYRQYLQNIPEEIILLVDKSSLKKTEENLRNYYQPYRGNYIFELLKSRMPYFSLYALESVKVSRIGVSDILEIVYTSNDPGITLNTVKFFSEELSRSYEHMKYRDVNEVVAYFEEQLKIKKKSLDSLEHELVAYNQENNVINYIEQTKAIAVSFTNYEDRLEQIKREYEAAAQLLRDLDEQMGVRAGLVRSNVNFVALLDSVAKTNGRIVELEIFNINNSSDQMQSELQRQKTILSELEKRISSVSDDINEQQYTKEGIVIASLAERWLEELVRSTKAKKEMEVLLERRKDFEDLYQKFSPIGAQLNSREREIRIVEESYLEVLHGLNMARLKQKNIQLTSSSLSTISKATYPTRDNGSKALIFTIIAVFATAIIVIVYYFLKEWLRQSLTDASRAYRITNVDVIGAMSANHELLYRGYIRKCHRKSALYISNQVNKFLNTDSTVYVNLVSIEPREGKSFLAKHIINVWRNKGFNVCYVKANTDFSTETPAYHTADSYENLIGDKIKDKKYDIILIEHQPLQKSNIPPALISSANLNIVVVNAERLWRKSDQQLLSTFMEQCSDTAAGRCLHYASRVAVDDLTGKLPPFVVS